MLSNIHKCLPIEATDRPTKLPYDTKKSCCTQLDFTKKQTDSERLSFNAIEMAKKGDILKIQEISDCLLPTGSV